MQVLGTSRDCLLVPQLTGLPRSAPAVKAAHPVDARGPVEARSSGAIVDVDRAVWPRPSVDANT